MSVKERLVELIRGEKLSQAKFERMIGVSNGYVNNIRQSIAPDKINMISQLFPEWNISYLMTGVGNPLLTVEAAPIVDVLPVLSEEVNHQPIYQDLGNNKLLMTIPLIEANSHARYIAERDNPQFLQNLPKQSIIIDKHQIGQYRAFEVKGDSMDDASRDAIYAGDILIAQHIDTKLWTPLHLEAMLDYVIVHQDAILVRRIISYNEENGTITCAGLHPNKEAFKDLVLSLDDIYEIYRVTEVARKRNR